MILLFLLLTAVVVEGWRSFAWRRHGCSVSRTAHFGSALVDTDLVLGELAEVLARQGLVAERASPLLGKLADAGLETSAQVVAFARDFTERPEVLSTILKEDFMFSAMEAHRLRAAMMALVVEKSTQKPPSPPPLPRQTPPSAPAVPPPMHDATAAAVPLAAATAPKAPANATARPLCFKKYNVVRARPATSATGHDYGLKEADVSPALARELDAFLEFMVTPSPQNQEPPIRRTTAIVYVRHTKLFLGYYLATRGHVGDSGQRAEVTLGDLFPSKGREGAVHAYGFVQWLRDARQISVSYEANLLRGLIKLCKFVFREESQMDLTAYETRKTYEDIPAVAELRRLHRQANRKQATSPRVSDERKKWLPWTDFLSVISQLRADVEEARRVHEDAAAAAAASGAAASTTTPTAPAHPQPAPKKSAAAAAATAAAMERAVAVAFQRYLILSFFSVVPDRQRTIRELWLGTTFQREDTDGTWVIKHGPDDYKVTVNPPQPPYPLPHVVTVHPMPPFSPVADGQELRRPPAHGHPRRAHASHRRVRRALAPGVGAARGPPFRPTAHRQRSHARFGVPNRGTRLLRQNGETDQPASAPGHDRDPRARGQREREGTGGVGPVHGPLHPHAALVVRPPDLEPKGGPRHQLAALRVRAAGDGW